ncbi:hypothetical protein [Actinoallomurus sp. CA-142502]|uniref:hypothetical protein n=1 Tax=Actinoallomurus sp. CA-142502 TaxID=3239885 RepID=UPI003D8BF98D
MPGTALELRHTPVTICVAGPTPEDPDFADACNRCWTDWPSLIAELASYPDARPQPIDWSAHTGPYAEEPPF